MQRQIRGEVAPHRAPDEDRIVEFELAPELHDEAHEEVLMQRILLLPPLDADGWDGLPVIGQVVRYQPIGRGDLLILERMPPLLAVRAGRVLKEHRDAASGFLEVHPVLHTVDSDVAVTTDRIVEASHPWLRSTMATARRMSALRRTAA